MKILIISPGKLPVPAVKGGAVENLIDSLVNQNINKNISVYSIKINDDYKKSKNTKIIEIDNNSFLYKINKMIRYIFNKYSNNYIGNSFIYNVVNDIKKSGVIYDYIIIENEPQYALYLKKKNIPGKYVLHLHNDYLNINTKYNKEIVKCLYKIIVVSNFIKKRVLEINQNLDVYTLYNCVDTKKFKRNDNLRLLYRNKYNIEKNDIVFSYSGRIVEEKGVFELVSAFNKFNNRIKNAKLVIFGGINYSNNDLSSYLSRIKKIVEKNENIIFTGYIKYDEIQYYYNMIDINILPTKINEAFGMGIIEFRSMGIPTIVSSLGAGLELVYDKKLGSVINFGNNKTSYEIYKAIIDYYEYYKKNKKSIIKFCENSINDFEYSNYFDKFMKILERN